MMHSVIIPSRQCGKTQDRERALEMAMLNLLYDHGPLTFAQLKKALACPPRELYHAVRSQYIVGTIRRPVARQPIMLSNAASTAIAAARTAMGQAA